MKFLKEKSKLLLSLLGASGAFSNTALAQSTNYNIGTATGAQWTQLTTWFQSFVSFINGPFGTAVVVVSLIIAFTVWNFAPREGIVGPIMRIVVSAIVILNVATWIGSF